MGSGDRARRAFLGTAAHRGGCRPPNRLVRRVSFSISMRVIDPRRDRDFIADDFVPPSPRARPWLFPRSLPRVPDPYPDALSNLFAYRINRDSDAFARARAKFYSRRSATRANVVLVAL